MTDVAFLQTRVAFPFDMTVCFAFFAVHGAALNMRASATEKGRAAGEKRVVLGRTSIYRANSYRADPNL